MFYEFLVQRHTRFERRNNDLHTNLTITLQDALNGFDVTLPHLDGHNVRIRKTTIVTLLTFSIGNNQT